MRKFYFYDNYVDITYFSSLWKNQNNLETQIY